MLLNIECSLQFFCPFLHLLFSEQVHLIFHKTRCNSRCIWCFGLHFRWDSMRWEWECGGYIHLISPTLDRLSSCLVVLGKMSVNCIRVEGHECLASLLKLLSFTFLFSSRISLMYSWKNTYICSRHLRNLHKSKKALFSITFYRVSFYSGHIFYLLGKLGWLVTFSCTLSHSHCCHLPARFSRFQIRQPKNF